MGVTVTTLGAWGSPESANFRVERSRTTSTMASSGQGRPWDGSVIYFVCHSLGQYNGVIHRNGMYIVPGAFQWPSPKVKAKSVNLAWDWIKGNMCYASNGVSLNLKGTKRWRKKIGDMILLIGTSGWRNTALIGLLTLPLTGRGALGWSGEDQLIPIPVYCIKPTPRQPNLLSELFRRKNHKISSFWVTKTLSITSGE